MTVTESTGVRRSHGSRPWKGLWFRAVEGPSGQDFDPRLREVLIEEPMSRIRLQFRRGRGPAPNPLRRCRARHIRCPASAAGHCSAARRPSSLPPLIARRRQASITPIRRTTSRREGHRPPTDLRPRPAPLAEAAVVAVPRTHSRAVARPWSSDTRARFTALGACPRRADAAARVATDDRNPLVPCP